MRLSSVFKSSFIEWLIQFIHKFFGKSLFQVILKIKEHQNDNYINKLKIGALMNINSQGILFTNGYKIIDVNPAVEKLFHLPKEQIIGKSIKAFLKPGIIIKKSENLFCIKIKRANGSYVFFDLSLRTIDRKNRIVCLKSPEISDQQILKAVLETEERERQHFSSEIHDGLGPAITVLQIYFQWLAESSSENRDFIIEKGNHYFEEAIRTIKEISYKHNPYMVENYGMTKAIDIFINKLNEANVLEIEFKCNIEARFKLQLEVSIYRIVTELINNTVKYAEANKAIVHLFTDDHEQQLILNYSDDGKGIKFKNLNNHESMGIINIKKRVHALNGTFLLKNSNCNGIEIEIILPVLILN